MTTDRKDAEWLKQMIVRLLTQASDQSSPDHPACAKYAELLFKMLPRGDSSQDADPALLAKARELAKQGD